MPPSRIKQFLWKTPCKQVGITDDTAVYAIVDTSVLVSGLRSNLGASHQILLAIRHRTIQIALSVPLALEYEAVALRPGLIPHLSVEEISSVIDFLCQVAHHQRVFFTWRPFLPDPNDDHMLELALAASCEFIITHNLWDFAGSDSMGVQAITPAQALTMI